MGAEKIVEKRADYMLGLKGNQGICMPRWNFFQDCLESGFKEMPYDSCQTMDGDHGRIEARRYWATQDIEWLSDKAS